MSSGSRSKVVVTGVGAVCSLGTTAAGLWRGLVEGETGLRPVRAFDATGLGVRVAGEVPDFNIVKEVPRHYRKATKVMARDIELAVMAAKNAFADAGLSTAADEAGPSFDSARFGTSIGAGLVSTDLNELALAIAAAEEGGRVDWGKWGREGMAKLTPLWLLKYLPNMLASHVTIIHGLTGPSNNLTCAEAGGHLSIGEAARIIERGDADGMVAGGAETLVSPMGMVRRKLLNRLTAGETVRPFADDADGTAVGEGGALLVLESADHAAGRGATVLAEVAGFGCSQDTVDPATPDLKGTAYAAAVTAALRDAGLSPADVDAVVPHGLGIPAHDAAELIGLRRVFGEALPPLVTTKHALGDTGAGCCLDAVVAVQCLRHERLPTDADARPRVILTTAFGLGGQNAAVVFRRP